MVLAIHAILHYNKLDQLEGGETFSVCALSLKDPKQMLCGRSAVYDPRY